jgi:hypothetical protein
VHLDYAQNGKLPSCMSNSEVRRSSKKNQVGTDVTAVSGFLVSHGSYARSLQQIELMLTLCHYIFPQDYHIRNLTLGYSF